MPLYTYISSYRGILHSEQGRFSNFKGFASGALGKIPDGALPGLTHALRTEMIEKALRCQWEAVPNRRNLWRATFPVGDAEFVVHVVHTDD